MSRWLSTWVIYIISSELYYVLTVVTHQLQLKRSALEFDLLLIHFSFKITFILIPDEANEQCLCTVSQKQLITQYLIAVKKLFYFFFLMRILLFQAMISHLKSAKCCLHSSFSTNIM